MAKSDEERKKVASNTACGSSTWPNLMKRGKKWLLRQLAMLTVKKVVKHGFFCFFFFVRVFVFFFICQDDFSNPNFLIFFHNFFSTVLCCFFFSFFFLGCDETLKQ